MEEEKLARGVDFQGDGLMNSRKTGILIQR